MKTLQQYSTALSILLGFALVAGALVYTRAGNLSAQSPNTVSAERTEHKLVYGNPKAKTTIVEFSDVNCPYCARLHPVLKQLVDESEDSIQWEYRHLPLRPGGASTHAAVVGECIAENVGTDAFWSFITGLYNLSGTKTELDINTAAYELGLTDAQISNCAEDTSLLERIQLDTITARQLGAQGTPFSVVLKKDGSEEPVNGALAYEQWVALLETN